jgi:hypothetical protein
MNARQIRNENYSKPQDSCRLSGGFGRSVSYAGRINKDVIAAFRIFPYDDERDDSRGRLREFGRSGG